MFDGPDWERYATIGMVSLLAVVLACGFIWRDKIITAVRGGAPAEAVATTSPQAGGEAAPITERRNVGRAPLHRID